MLYNLFGFSGRIGRLEFLLYGFVTFVLVTIAVVLAMGLMVSGQSVAAVLVPLLLGIAVISASMLAITAKRLHDLDLSGWHAVWIFGLHLASPGLHERGGFLGTFCAIFSALMWLFLLLAPGTDAPNSFDGSRMPAPQPRRRPGDRLTQLNLGRF